MTESVAVNTDLHVAAVLPRVCRSIKANRLSLFGCDESETGCVQRR